MPKEKPPLYPIDKKEWISSDDLKPSVLYELVWVKDASKRVSTAWWTGTTWDGMDKVNFDTIQFWKPFTNYNIK